MHTDTPSQERPELLGVLSALLGLPGAGCIAGVEKPMLSHAAT